MGWLSSSVGKAINSITGVSDSMNAQNAYNTKMWNAQNEYNSPSAQLARMREAGIDINPTSYALGTGNLSNTASHVTSGSGSPAGNPISALMGVASGIQGIKEAGQRIDNMKEQNFNLKVQGTNEIARGDQILEQTQATRLANAIAQHNLEIGRETHTPVGQMPGLMQALVQAGSSMIHSDMAKDVWNWLSTDSTKFPWKK